MPKTHAVRVFVKLLRACHEAASYIRNIALCAFHKRRENLDATCCCKKTVLCKEFKVSAAVIHFQRPHWNRKRGREGSDGTRGDKFLKFEVKFVSANDRSVIRRSKTTRSEQRRASYTRHYRFDHARTHAGHEKLRSEESEARRIGKFQGGEGEASGPRVTGTRIIIFSRGRLHFKPFNA